MSKQLIGIAFLLLGNIIAQPYPLFFWAGLALGVIGFVMVLANTEENDK